MYAYANVYFKTTIIKQNINIIQLWECLEIINDLPIDFPINNIISRECLRAGLPLGFPNTASPPVCVSSLLGTLACGSQTKKIKK